MQNEQFLVVGIGASAGGIQAIRKFFQHVPPKTGIAYVVVLHLSPDHDSHLADVLQSSANIPVTQVQTRVRVQPDHVYVIPPDKNLAIQDGHLVLSEVTGFEQRHAPVDIFFRTLAESHRAKAVCVVLSGTGANGSMGLKRVKERGGVSIVQDPEEAENGEMPRDSIATGLVDYVLPVAAIPAKILAYQSTLNAVQLSEHAPEAPDAFADESATREVFSLLRSRTGHDFSNYKRATVLRRIARRMGLHEVTTLEEYARYLREHADEPGALLNELLVSVTSFFRDREAFATLEQLVIPRLLQRKREDDVVRVWVPGCATGEEAYSIAMLLAESSAAMPGTPGIQIFGSDIDGEAIAVALEGAYTLYDTADVGAERLRRFFLKEGGRYVVRKELRELVLFAQHNLLKDPPFSHLDLVSCRNVLIYLNRSAQQRVLEVLHFALNPGGYLFLGTSESVAGSGNLFVTVDKDAHIFQSRAIAARLPMMPLPELPAAGRPSSSLHGERTAEQRARERLSAADLHLRLLEQYAPPSIVVNEEHEIVHLTELAGRYLMYAGGEPSHNLLKAVRPELRLEVRTALYQALQQQTNVQTPPIPVRLGDRVANVSVEVRPVLRENDTARGFFLLMFREGADGALPAPAPTSATMAAGDAARQLEGEIVRVRAQLRATIERHETQAEDLKASNEELQAINEELRSSTEELETSKEELQSLNEELRTVNQELKIKIEEQTQANDDIQNLINSTEIGTIFLDRSSRIKLFTPRARDLFTLIPADRGRPLSDINSALVDINLYAEIERMLERLERSEREVRTRDDRWYLMRVLPYRTGDDRIDGVVLTFVDITPRKRVEEALRASEERLRRAITIHTVGIIFFRTDGTITDANDAFLRLSGYERDEIVRGRVRWDAIMPPDFVRRLEEFKPQTDAVGSTPPFEQEYVRKDGSRWWGLLALTGLGGTEAAAFVVDITAVKQAEELADANKALDAELRQRRRAEEQIRGLMRRLITVQEDERRLVARDLHDHLGQQVAGLALKLDALKQMARGHAALESAIDDARATIVKLDRDLDFFVWEMRAADRNDQGLVATLAAFVREWSRNFGIPAEFHSRGFEGERLPKEIAINLYRITQEALNNAYKHARARRVEVLLERRDSSAVLVIEDDGVGFDRSARPVPGTDGGVGLVGMQERAALMGGTLEIETAPGKGTSVFVQVPFKAFEEKEKENGAEP